MRVAIDTNVLAYAEGVGDAERCRVAIGLVERLPEPAVLLPAQVLGELMLVLARQAGRTREAARDAVLAWADSFEPTAKTHCFAFSQTVCIVCWHDRSCLLETAD